MIAIVSMILIALISVIPDFNKEGKKLSAGTCIKLENNKVYKISNIDSVSKIYKANEITSIGNASWELWEFANIEMSDINKNFIETKCPDTK